MLGSITTNSNIFIMAKSLFQKPNNKISMKKHQNGLLGVEVVNNNIWAKRSINMKINSTTYVPYLTLRFFDKEHGLGLMNNLLNYLGLDLFKSELCELD